MNAFRCSFVAAVSVVLCAAGPGRATALDDYVATADPAYNYQLVRTMNGSGYTAYVLDMQSQNWRGSVEVDRKLWQHWLTIVVPDVVNYDTALLYISGGDNGGSAPSSAPSEVVSIAANTQSVAAQLRMVPNQPLTFPDGGGPREEDEIIAYTYDKYLVTGDETWPLLLPMVKSAVRAMDTIQDFLSQPRAGRIEINYFAVTGASKRGWTTWLTGAVDPRVVAIMPMVIDVLNIDEQMRHHFAAYGDYSEVIHDYVDLDVISRIYTPQGQALLEIVDPYEYRQRYALPKYLLNSTGDQFFLPDSSQFYYGDLPGDKYLRYVPNTDHGLRGTGPDSDDALESLTLFYYSVLEDWSRPEFNWTVVADNRIEVETTTSPIQVRLWQAANPEARNFRLDRIGAAWNVSELADQGGGTYVAQVPEPEQGWRAFFVELIFDNATDVDYKFTTEVRVVPDYLPFACDLNRDGAIDFLDMEVLADEWLGWETLRADIVPEGGNGRVNLHDFALCASNWDN
ncbi:MAG: PhoPQ-activated protein PqaA family protein [Planctomycetota bacterium]|jgi:PhoPQ-activated pathogenicity-related protein